MIVKVQLPLYVNEPRDEQEALVYNEDRSIEVMLPIDDELRHAMDGQVKAFFEADVKYTLDGAKILQIEEHLEDQGW